MEKIYKIKTLQSTTKNLVRPQTKGKKKNLNQHKEGDNYYAYGDRPPKKPH